MKRIRKANGLAVAGIASFALLFGCESTQKADTSADAAVDAEPAAATDAAPADESTDAAVSAEAGADRADPFSEERVNELEGGLKPLESVPINTGLSNYGNDETSVG